MKIYVTEKTKKTSDGDKLVIVQTHKSKPHNYKYIIFLER